MDVKREIELSCEDFCFKYCVFSFRSNYLSKYKFFEYFCEGNYYLILNMKQKFDI